MRVTFHYRQIRTLPLDLVQDVWDDISTHPQAHLHEIAERTQRPKARVELAVMYLKRHGFLDFSKQTKRSRTIHPPKYAVKASYLDEVL